MDLSTEILSLYISSEEISRTELRGLVEKSYKTFRHPDVTPLHKLDDKTYILELFHGPTFAFKDVALQLLGNLFEFFLSRKNAQKAEGETPESLTVVGATSGDTGRYVSAIAINTPYPNGYTVLLSTVSGARRMSPSSSFTPRVASLPSRRHK